MTLLVVTTKIADGMAIRVFDRFINANVLSVRDSLTVRFDQYFQIPGRSGKGGLTF